MDTAAKQSEAAPAGSACEEHGNTNAHDARGEGRPTRAPTHMTQIKKENGQSEEQALEVNLFSTKKYLFVSLSLSLCIP